MSDGSADGRLTTHVLDTAKGCPAADMRIDLYRVDGDEAELVKSVRTNDDGRTDGPMLAGADFRIGEYELRFHAGDYIGGGGVAFLNVVPVRFGVGDASAHYHVPLLVSPYGYSTYRGS
ncbi:MAG: hydroxyisourate hydrolase [Rhizobiaceae bacterium]